MIALLFKLIFAVLGALLGLVWWMIKVWFAVAIGVILAAIGLIFF